MAGSFFLSLSLFWTSHCLNVALPLQGSIWVHLSQVRHAGGPLCPLRLQGLSMLQCEFLSLPRLSGPSQISHPALPLRHQAPPHAPRHAQCGALAEMKDSKQIHSEATEEDMLPGGLGGIPQNRGEKMRRRLHNVRSGCAAHFHPK